MDEIKYIVYAKVDENGCITDVESTAFHDEQKLIDDGFIKIDEGTDGHLHGHAQPNYLIEKYGQPKMDDEMHYNYKLVDNVPTLLTDEEKQALNPPVKPQPTEQDLINADIYMQLAQLQMSGISMMSLNSPRYDLLKKYYDMGIYNDENMKVFVACGWLTPEEYKQITGSVFVAKVL